MHALTTLASSIVIAATVYAAPTSSTTGEPVAKSTPFGIVLQAQGPYNGLVLRLQAADSGSTGRNLVFEQPSAFSPSPAYLNGTAQQLNASAGGFAYLNFINNDKDSTSDFGVYLPDIGDGPGFTDSVIADLGIGDPDFNVGNNQLFGEPRAAPNIFLACNATLGSGQAPVLNLEWGNENENGSFAEGCVPASLLTVPITTSP